MQIIGFGCTRLTRSNKRPSVGFKTRVSCTIYSNTRCLTISGWRRSCQSWALYIAMKRKITSQRRQKKRLRDRNFIMPMQIISTVKRMAGAWWLGKAWASCWRRSRQSRGSKLRRISPCTEKFPSIGQLMSFSKKRIRKLLRNSKKKPKEWPCYFVGTSRRQTMSSRTRRSHLRFRCMSRSCFRKYRMCLRNTTSFTMLESRLIWW